MIIIITISLLRALTGIGLGVIILVLALINLISLSQLCMQEGIQETDINYILYGIIYTNVHDNHEYKPKNSKFHF